MKVFLSLLSTILFMFASFSGSMAQHSVFLSNESLTWEKCISKYQKMDDQFPEARLMEYGTTDVGKPLHLFVINKDGVFYPELFDRKKVVIFVNNAIHPGEPDGVDASVLFCEELLEGKLKELNGILDHVIFCFIPMYNVDGALNRGSFSRANQNGPAEYGFRGNAKNLDLNRDFIKCDSQNAQSFTQIFTAIRPHVFIDTHVSNGADYQHTMTLISTQTDKLGGPLGTYMRESVMPQLFEGMKNKGHDMCPYVNTMGRLPESGLVDFLETPRFASGYSTLFNSIGFITETLMLKPFPERVESTWQFFHTLSEFCMKNYSEIINQRRKADEFTISQTTFPVQWQLDTSFKEKFTFLGYEAEEKPSSFGGTRIKYNHQKPFEKPIPYFSKFKPQRFEVCPDFYVIPQAWTDVLDRLKWNGISMTRIDSDTIMQVDFSYIESYKTSESPYEGHYVHSDIMTRDSRGSIPFFEGDWLIPTNQAGKRYLVEVLEPEGEDSFFAWNFFDSILQQKEWFSDYVFEEKAEELLAKDSELKKTFEEAIQKDSTLKNSRWNQLYWIYKHSPYYEKSANRYPVYRLSIGK